MTIRVHALEDSSHLRPDGDCYAPQVVLTSARYGYDSHELNGRMLPFQSPSVVWVFERFGELTSSPAHVIEMMQRYYRAFYDTEMHHKVTHGYSQSDWGHSFVFATPEWLEVTGAPGVRESDHNDFCAWLWGDVYEVFDDNVEHMSADDPHAELRDYDEDCPMVVYGMDEAMKYGEITFPTHHTITTYEYD